jgi:hypothetical protein
MARKTIKKKGKVTIIIGKVGSKSLQKDYQRSCGHLRGHELHARRRLVFKSDLFPDLLVFFNDGSNMYF